MYLGLSIVITYRRSTGNDLQGIQNIFGSSFGTRNVYDPNYLRDTENGRYLLALDDDIVIGMTGIIDSGMYNGYELDWTCLDKNYRGQGIMTTMIQLELSRVGSVDVYCACWAGINDAVVHMHHAMDTLGFKLVIPSKVIYNSEHTSWCKKECIKYKEGCICREDLYLRKAT